MQNDQLDIPSNMSLPTCGLLTTLLLGSCGIDSIPESFFEHMRGLKVLDLSWNKIKSAPTSIVNLKYLKILFLNSCNDLKRVPSLSNLQALKKLNLAWTRIDHLPYGMERLVNLEYLDLNGIHVDVADGYLSKVTYLRRLKIGKFVRAEELIGLKKLEHFEGAFYDFDELNDYVQALCARTKRPCKYWISVGGLPTSPFLTRKSINIVDRCIPVDGQGIKILYDVEELIIEDCTADLSYEEKPIFSWFIPVPHDTFSSLSRLVISFCKQIKKLFSGDWVLRDLHNLEDISVWNCQEMEEIISISIEEEGMGTNGNNSIELITLPKLRWLKLVELLELRCICSPNGARMVCDSLQKIRVLECPKLRRIPLYLPLLENGNPYPPPPPLQNTYVTNEEWWESLEWDHPRTKDVLQRFVGSGHFFRAERIYLYILDSTLSIHLFNKLLRNIC